MAKSNQAGFSMIEVLVSICVISIGLLGAAGMQLAALRTTQQSSLETAALYLAVDMANKIRSSVSINKWSDDHNPYLEFNYRKADQKEQREVSCLPQKEACSAEELARLSISEWESRIKEKLPKARSMICRDSSPWNAEDESYKWECTNTPNGHAPLVIKIGWQEKKMTQTTSQNNDANDAPKMVVVVGS